MQGEQQTPEVKRRRLPLPLRLLRGLVMGYVIVLLLVWAFQSRMVYFPTSEVDLTPGSWVAFEDVTLTADDGTKLGAWYIPAMQSKGTILFCHGNAGNMSNRIDSLALFYQLDYSVLIFDYRGYGTSEGSPDEEGTYQDARAAWDYLVNTRKVDPGEIAIFGRSLGGAVAAKVAAEKKPAALILESTFTSIPDVGADKYWFLPVRLLSRFQYDTREAVGQVGCPVLVVHSPDDEMIPFGHGQALFQAAPEPKEFLEITGRHNDGFTDCQDIYAKGLKTFLGRHVRTARTRPAEATKRDEDG